MSWNKNTQVEASGAGGFTAAHLTGQKINPDLCVCVFVCERRLKKVGERERERMMCPAKEPGVKTLCGAVGTHLHGQFDRNQHRANR